MEITQNTNYNNQLKFLKRQNRESYAQLFKHFSALNLVDYLESNHQDFSNKIIPKIEQNFLLLTRYFENNRQLNTLFNIFIKFQINFNNHIKIEEKTFFVYVKALAEFQKTKNVNSLEKFNVSISEYAHQHENSEFYLSEIINVLKKQKLDTLPVYNILLRQLIEFDTHIKEHAWIENTVFIEKAKELEIEYKNYINKK